MSSSGRSTIFLRLEGPLQAWGDTSKFVIRRTMDAPTKSGVLGLVCCAMGLDRNAARGELTQLNTLTMGVRMDNPGTRWWDYHTVGAGIGMMTAAGKRKTGAQGTLITRREYLADASFLVALQGETELVSRVADALRSPVWPVFLGRKSCPPSVPVFAQPCKDQTKESETGWSNPSMHDSLKAALESVPFQRRYKSDPIPHSLETIIEWRAASDQDIAPADAQVWHDTPFSFDPPVHHPRLVTRGTIKSSNVHIGSPTQRRAPSPARPRAGYSDAEWTSDALVDVTNELTGQITKEPRGARPRRLKHDSGLCVFCKNQASTVQHITYRRAGGNETQDDLCSLCRLCHDAVTMIEYGQGMGIDRIDPTQVRWRTQIIQARNDILAFRSNEGRRRALRDAPRKVQAELLEESEG